MILSNKDLRFLIESVETQIKTYQERQQKAESVNNENEIADLGNDIEYLKLLSLQLQTTLSDNTSPSKTFN